MATTVTLGSVAYPMLPRSATRSNAAASAGGGRPPGDHLAAGAGRAAFLIAEFLKISYLDVLLMVILTLLFYFALFLMVEIDARKYGMHEAVFEKVDTAWNLTRKYWFHFLSLISIVVFMLWGFSPVMSVFWATVVSLATSMLRRDTALIPYDLSSGSAWRNSAVAPGQGAGGRIGRRSERGGHPRRRRHHRRRGHAHRPGAEVQLHRDRLRRRLRLLTAFFTALVVWIVGLAVPVTASYIICAVIAAPALIKLGVPEFAAHMFIFYYAVLSEVSPPTALSPFAAAAITGGDPYKTTLQCWKYTMPAFLVPFMFVLDPAGRACC